MAEAEKEHDKYNDPEQEFDKSFVHSGSLLRPRVDLILTDRNVGRPVFGFHLNCRGSEDSTRSVLRVLPPAPLQPHEMTTPMLHD